MATRGRRNGHARRGFLGYGSYMFKDKAPSIDEFRTLVQEQYGVQKITRKILTDIHSNGGASVGAMEGWLFKDTKRPTDPAMEASGRAMGYYRRWTRMPADMAAQRDRMLARFPGK